MATVLRLKRIGAKKAPVYRIIVTDSRNKRDGRSIEVLGIYNPRSATEQVELKNDRVQHWLDTGATPSDTVRSILRTAGFYRPEGPSTEAPEPAAVVVAEEPEVEPVVEAEPVAAVEESTEAVVEAEPEAIVEETTEAVVEESTEAGEKE